MVALLVCLLIGIYIQKEQGLARPALLLFSRAAPALHPAVPALAGGGASRCADAVNNSLYLYYITYLASALSIFPIVIAHRLAWMRGALALCPVSRIPQMEPLADWAIIFIGDI